MVKVLYLGLFAAIVCALVALTLAVPVGSTISRNSSSDVPYHHHTKPQEVIILSDDGAVRSERSTNLSHITGSARKIQMYVKNRHLQILPDGTVNGTSDDTSDYSKSPPQVC
ncbi:branchless [Carabus blaptoides fortunei]